MVSITTNSWINWLSIPLNNLWCFLFEINYFMLAFISWSSIMPYCFKIVWVYWRSNTGLSFHTKSQFFIIIPATWIYLQIWASCSIISLFIFLIIQNTLSYSRLECLFGLSFFNFIARRGSIILFISLLIRNLNSIFNSYSCLSTICFVLILVSWTSFPFVTIFIISILLLSFLSLSLIIRQRIQILTIRKFNHKWELWTLGSMNILTLMCFFLLPSKFFHLL